MMCHIKSQDFGDDVVIDVSTRLTTSKALVTTSFLLLLVRHLLLLAWHLLLLSSLSLASKT